MADIQVDVGVIYQKSCSLTHISLYFLKFRMKIFMIQIFFHPLILNLKKKKNIWSAHGNGYHIGNYH